MASSSTAPSSAPMGLGLGLGLGAMGGLGLLLPADRDLDPELDPCSPPRSVLRLRGAVQHYEWGSRGDASLVARLAGETGEAGRPCAELWMGTHPAAPSSLEADGASLREWLARSPAALLGRAVTARWGGDLPFLFKVLSVAQPLSIQAHPDRDLARALHALRPATYRDANHKPEMAVAVTEFRALCGFVSIQVFLCEEDAVPGSPPLMSQEIEKPTSYVHIGAEGMLSIIAENIESTYQNAKSCNESPSPPPLKRVKKVSEEMVKLGREDEVTEMIKVVGGDAVPAFEPLNLSEHILKVSEQRLKRINYLEKELSRMYSDKHKLHEKRRWNNKLVHVLQNATVRAAEFIEDVTELHARLVIAATGDP